MVPTNAGNGNVTSSARYAAAVAADTTEVEVKSNSNSAAPIRAKVLVETFRLGKSQYPPEREDVSSLTCKCKEHHRGGVPSPILP